MRSVEGTERDIARGIRADEYAACGRTSMIRVFRSSTHCVRDEGRTELKDIKDRKQPCILFITSSTLLYSSINMDPSDPSDSTSTYFLGAPRATRLRGGPLGRSS